jgi:hypothetical protein
MRVLRKDSSEERVYTLDGRDTVYGYTVLARYQQAFA